MSKVKTRVHATHVPVSIAGKVDQLGDGCQDWRTWSGSLRKNAPLVASVFCVADPASPPAVFS